MPNIGPLQKVFRKLPFGVDARDLAEQTGIYMLTGESDGTSMGRILCDVNAKGKELIEEFFGGRLKLEDEATWGNSGKVAGEPAVSSIMLTRQVIDEIHLFSLLKEHKQLVGGYKNHVLSDLWALTVPLEEVDFEATEILKDCFKYTSVRRFYVSGTAGTRNVHQISGRVT